jgi:1-acyl-sn-glycerol-3-phosphate acyltransferase
MLNLLRDPAMPSFWPPRPHPFWTWLLEPLRRYYLHRFMRVAEIAVEGIERFQACLAPGDSVLLAPNHSDHADPQVMLEIGRRIGRQFYFMAAWQVFTQKWGLEGFIMQRMGAFSVDRENSDRRSIQQAINLLITAQTLVVFPEGEVYHLNERLTPLLDGVAHMGLLAQRKLEQTHPEAHVWLVPVAIRYCFLEEIHSRLEAVLAQMEQRFLLKASAGQPVHERLVRLGEMLLTLKEKDQLGRSRDSEGSLPERLQYLIEAMLARLEQEWLKTGKRDDTVPLRLMRLRRTVLDVVSSGTADEVVRARGTAALDDLHLITQLFSYPGDYLLEKVCPERMAETLTKLQEDMTGRTPRPLGRRRARVLLGEPIDLNARSSRGRSRTLARELTTELEDAIAQLLKSEQA